MAESEKSIESRPVLFGGSCACGRVTYESRTLPTSSQLCHCVTCRKLGGGVFQAFPNIDSKQLTFYNQKEHLRYEGLPKDNIGGIVFLRLMKGAERASCVECHSPLAMRYLHDYVIIGLMLATVDEETIRDDKVKQALKPISHIFASQNPDWWYNISLDGLPIRDRFKANFEEKMKAWIADKQTRLKQANGFEMFEYCCRNGL